MALLNFANITNHRPDILMKKVFYGLQDFYQFLDITKKYLESPKAIKRLAWEKVDVEENDQQKTEDVWVRLVEPKNSRENFDATLKLFLDDNNKAVYEASENNWKSIGSASRECPKCPTKYGKPKIAYQSKEHANEVVIKSKIKLKIYKCPYGEGWHLTKDPNGIINMSNSKKINILERDTDKELLKLEHLPQESFLVLRPSTYQIQCQIRAIQALQNNPKPTHRSLLRLFENNSHAEWSDVELFSSSFNDQETAEIAEELKDKAFDRYDNCVSEWHVLTDENRDGTLQQREWVNICLSTPDFAFLEGPPGSGKTTAICELIIQLALREKRVLLCASTHVAVDNVIERLMGEKTTVRDAILPVRIGDKFNVSEKAKHYRFEELLQTEKKRLLKHLNNQKHLSSSQKELLTQLKSGKDTLQKMILEASNLICGTTIGILQHPNIREKDAQSPQFDFMIIDEASKTTLQEFLVPALLAERWVMVGDPKQLSPYVDDESMAINIEPCLPHDYRRKACLDVFRASQSGSGKGIHTLIGSDGQGVIEYYEKQAESKNVAIGTPKSNIKDLPYSSLVVGNTDFFVENQNRVPLDIRCIRKPELIPESIKRRVLAYCRLSKKELIQDEDTWATEISWRLTRLYEQRLDERSDARKHSTKKSTSEKYHKEINQLLPFDDGKDKNSVWWGIDRVRRVALPSILESLQNGFERTDYQTTTQQGTAISDGIPEDAKKRRTVRLSFQHRMHPDIAEFSHTHIYEEQALFSPDDMAEKRQWGYRTTSKRCVWQDVKGAKNNNNINQKEVDKLMLELERFDSWARMNPNKDEQDHKKPWEVVLLTFYRGQERALRNALRKWTKQENGFRYFHRDEKNNRYMDIQVCTVDRFQGHESDLVLLSFVSHYKTSFLESPNRLNVAITRARYQLVVFGNRDGKGGLKKASGVLGKFIEKTPYDKIVNHSRHKEVKNEL